MPESPAGLVKIPIAGPTQSVRESPDGGFCHFCSVNTLVMVRSRLPTRCHWARGKDVHRQLFQHPRQGGLLVGGGLKPGQSDGMTQPPHSTITTTTIRQDSPGLPGEERGAESKRGAWPEGNHSLFLEERGNLPPACPSLAW